MSNPKGTFPHKKLIYFLVLFLRFAERWQPNRLAIIATASIVQLYQFNCRQWRHRYTVRIASSWFRPGTLTAHHRGRHYRLLVDFNGKFLSEFSRNKSKIHLSRLRRVFRMYSFFNEKARNAPNKWDVFVLEDIQNPTLSRLPSQVVSFNFISIFYLILSVTAVVAVLSPAPNGTRTSYT